MNNGKTKKHEGRTDLIGEHKTGDAGQALFAVLFATVYIADSFIFNFSTWLNELVPNIIRVSAGTVVLILSGILSFGGLRIVFNEVREKPEVIRKGVFAIVRHPVYLGEILVYLGMLLFSMSAASFSVWLFAVLFLHYIARYEERILLEHFGEEYRSYMNEVPMWIPKLSGLFRTRKQR